MFHQEEEIYLRASKAVVEEIMTKSHMKEATLARRANVSQTLVNQFLSNPKRDITSKKLFCILKALKLSFEKYEDLVTKKSKAIMKEEEAHAKYQKIR